MGVSLRLMGLLVLSFLLCVLPSSAADGACHVPAATLGALDSLKARFGDAATPDHMFSYPTFQSILAAVGLGRGTITVQSPGAVIEPDLSSHRDEGDEHDDRMRRDADIQIMIQMSSTDSTAHITPISHSSHFDFDAHPNDLCLNTSALYGKYTEAGGNGSAAAGLVSYQSMMQMCPELLNQVAQLACVHHVYDVHFVVLRDIQLWRSGVGALLAIAGIGSVSFASILCLNCVLERDSSVGLVGSVGYKRCITFFISVAVGTLSGDAFLHLIPEAISKGSFSHGHGDSQTLRKLICVPVTILLLHLSEIAMETLRDRGSKSKHVQAESVPLGAFTVENGSAAESRPSSHGRGSHGGHSHGCSGGGTTSLIVMVGDGFHNLVDGLAIGSAFSGGGGGFTGGISTSVAVFLHEVPHEVGDFVMLVNEGMANRSVLLFSLLSNLLSLAGAAIGLTLGVNTDSGYVLCSAAGGFLYISLCKMLPECYDRGGGGGGGQVSSDVIGRAVSHVAGLVTGLAIMAAIALKEQHIESLVSQIVPQS